MCLSFPTCKVERVTVITSGFLLSTECDTGIKHLAQHLPEEGFGNTHYCYHLPRNGPSTNLPNHGVPQTFRVLDSTLSSSPTPTAQSKLPRHSSSHWPLPTTCYLEGLHFLNPILGSLIWPAAIASTRSPCCPHPIPSSPGEGDRSSGVELRPGHSPTQQPSIAPHCLCSKVHFLLWRFRTQKITNDPNSSFIS